MSNLARFENDGIELVIDTETGEAFATQAGYVRMSGKSKSTISDRVSKGVRSGEVKDGEIQTTGGLQGVRLIPADLVYDWLFEDNKELARAMGKIGATVYMHQLAGYKISSSAIASEPEPQQMQLPPADVRVSNLINALDRIGFDMENPRFNQGIKDLTGDILGLGQKSLQSADDENEVWCGVTERAEQLGYPAGEVSRKRSLLGKWVAQSKLPKKQEMRSCNGTQRSVNLYLVSKELDVCIDGFFAED